MNKRKKMPYNKLSLKKRKIVIENLADEFGCTEKEARELMKLSTREEQKSHIEAMLYGYI